MDLQCLFPLFLNSKVFKNSRNFFFHSYFSQSLFPVSANRYFLLRKKKQNKPKKKKKEKESDQKFTLGKQVQFSYR